MWKSADRKKMGKLKPNAMTWVLILAFFQLPHAAFMADDFIILGIMEKVSPLKVDSPLHLYSFSDGRPDHVLEAKESGAFPWFFHPRWQLNFFRPLSSALLRFDHSLFGLRPLGYHLHNILWLLFLVWGVTVLMRKILPGPTGQLAAIIYAVSGILSIAVFWTSSRHHLVGATIGLWAFLGHLSWLEKRRFVFLALSLAGFALALLASETAVAMLAYPISHAFLAPRIERKHRLLSLLPLFFLTLGYIAFYTLGGYGGGYSSGYINPLAKPLVFLFALPAKLAATVATLIFGGITDIASASSVRSASAAANPIHLLGLIGALCMGLIIWCRRSHFSPEEKAPFDWLLVASLLSSLPMAAGMAVSFHLLIPFCGWSAVLAFLIRNHPSRQNHPHPVSRFFLQTGRWSLILFHLVLGPLHRAATPMFLKKNFNDRLVTVHAAMDRDFPGLNRQRMIILDAPDLAIGFHSYFFRRLQRLPMPLSWHTLYWGPDPLPWRRSGENLLDVGFPGKGMARNGFAKCDVIRLDGMEVRIQEVAAGQIRSFSCKTDLNLADPTYLFLTWKGERFVRVDMPALARNDPQAEGPAAVQRDPL